MRYLSVFDNDPEILCAMSDIFLKGQWYDLDCTYSKGVFYKTLQQSKLKSDIEPICDDVIKSDCRNLEFVENNSLNSVVFDPPFLFRNRKSANNNKICERFSYFRSFDDLIEMYRSSIDCFDKKLIFAPTKSFLKQQPGIPFAAS